MEEAKSETAACVGSRQLVWWPIARAVLPTPRPQDGSDSCVGEEGISLGQINQTARETNLLISLLSSPKVSPKVSER